MFHPKTSLTDLHALVPEGKQGFPIYFIPNIKREAKSNLKLEPNIRGLKAAGEKRGRNRCPVQNVDKTAKKQEQISNIMSLGLKIMAELQVLQMSTNCIDVTKVFCLIAKKLRNLYLRFLPVKEE